MADLWRVTYMGEGVKSTPVGAFVKNTTAYVKEEFAKTLVGQGDWDITDPKGNAASAPKAAPPKEEKKEPKKEEKAEKADKKDAEKKDEKAEKKKDEKPADKEAKKS